jgi:phosphatidylserine/phosphatidylglycerophosphate/cardiolipin synthase-like enzyme
MGDASIGGSVWSFPGRHDRGVPDRLRGLAAAAGTAAEVALRDTSDTVIARELAPQLAAHPGESVFYPLAAGTDAFAMRIALARVAQRSLDIQYYIYETDDTGLTLQPPSWPRQIVACGCGCCSMTSIWPGRTRCCR